MINWTLFAISLVWIGAGSWAILYSNESRATRLLGIITLILGTQTISWIL